MDHRLATLQSHNVAHAKISADPLSHDNCVHMVPSEATQIHGKYKSPFTHSLIRFLKSMS